MAHGHGVHRQRKQSAGARIGRVGWKVSGSVPASTKALGRKAGNAACLDSRDALQLSPQPGGSVAAIPSINSVVRQPACALCGAHPDRISSTALLPDLSPGGPRFRFPGPNPLRVSLLRVRPHRESRPLLHQCTPFRQQVRTGIGPFHRTADRMR